MFYVVKIVFFLLFLFSLSGLYPATHNLDYYVYMYISYHTVN